jgi:hypothetical protein
MAVSWVRKVRHIQDVAPWLQPLPKHKSEEEQMRIDDRNFEKSLPALGRYPFISRDHRPYFGSRMHDSGAMRLDVRGTKLTLTLDGFNPGCFARGMDQLFGTKDADQPWPVHLVAHGVHDFRMINRDAQGKVVTIPLPKGLDDCFNIDWAWQEGYRICWVFMLFECGIGLVDCDRLTARDESRKRIAHVYGPTLGRMFDEMLQLRRSPIPMTEYMGFWVEGPQRYVQLRAKSLGITLDDIAREIAEVRVGR